MLEQLSGTQRNQSRPEPGRPETINSSVVFSANGWVLSVGLDAPAPDARIAITTDDGKTWPARADGPRPQHQLVAVRDRRCQLLGFCSHHYSQSRTQVSTTLAQPIAMVLDVVRRLQARGGAPQACLGISESMPTNGSATATAIGPDRVQAATPAASSASSTAGLSGGVIVAKVDARGPAETAGLGTGDVLLGFDGHTVQDWERLTWLVRWAIPGEKVPIKLLRGSHALH